MPDLAVVRVLAALQKAKDDGCPVEVDDDPEALGTVVVDLTIA